MESRCITDIARNAGVVDFRTYRANYKAGGGRVKLYGVNPRNFDRLTKLIKQKYPLVEITTDVPNYYSSHPSITVKFPKSMDATKAEAPAALPKSTVKFVSLTLTLEVPKHYTRRNVEGAVRRLLDGTDMNVSLNKMLNYIG